MTTSLEHMDWTELRALAKTHGVKTGKTSREKVIDELLPLLQAQQQQGPRSWMAYPPGSRRKEGWMAQRSPFSSESIFAYNPAGQQVACFNRKPAAGKAVDYYLHAEVFIDGMRARDAVSAGV